MKKKLYRVKQLAEASVGWTEKTHLMNADIEKVAKTVEKIKITYQMIQKRLGENLSTTNDDIFKRKKRNPKLDLSTSILENSSTYEFGSLIGNVLQVFGRNLMALAVEHSNFEFTIENVVLYSINQILENDIPSIERLKKKLENAGLDMDSCKARLAAAQNDKKKYEQIKMELDALKSKFENTQDLFSIEVLNFVSREKDFANVCLKAIDAERSYHNSSILIMNDALPEIEQIIEDSSNLSVYGIPLDILEKLYKREISFVVEECSLFILSHGINIEGIFRITSSSSRIKKLRKSFDVGIVNFNEYIHDIHSVTSVLKLFFRELPEPLLTNFLLGEWSLVNLIDDKAKKKEKVLQLLKKLPDVNFRHLRYFICFLTQIAQHSDVNKMNSNNLSKCIGPNLLWTTDENNSMAVANAASNLTELLIDDYLYFFSSNVDFIHEVVETDELKLEDLSLNS